MKMLERNETAEKAALLIHPMLSCGEGIEQCVTDFWGTDIHCFIPDLSAHGEAAGETYHDATEEALTIHDYLTERGLPICSWALALPLAAWCCLSFCVIRT